MKAKNLLSFQFILLFFVLPLLAFPQGKQGNNWYFYDRAGMTFNYGDPPQLLYDGQLTFTNESVTTMSDENGNLLFYGNGNTIWNREHDTMLNGNNVGNPFVRLTFQIMAIPVPGSSHLYYYLTFDQNDFVYSTIDMNLDNGKGAVNPLTKHTHLCYSLTSVTAVHHKNQTDIWLVVHKQGGTLWNSFKVTANGIEGPYVSNAGSNFPSAINESVGIKLSPDGTKLAATVYADVSGNPPFCEVYDFDSETGYISDENMVHIDYSGSTVAFPYAEFSPNSSLLYVKLYDHLFQYNLKAGTPQQIAMSAVALPLTVNWGGVLQLGPDGKIYFPRGWEYMSVIHNPNVLGLGCNYEENYLYFENNWDFTSLPCILPSFLREYEFETEKFCSGEPTQFKIVSTNGIDSVYWKFGDFQNAPHDTSTLLNPSYTYSGPGTYYPKLTIYSGNWPPKILIDTITIMQSPNPNLGNDTSYCANESISKLLVADEGQSYAWNDVPGGNQTYLVTVPGTYWVEVINKGCIGRDTIDIIQYSEPVVDTSNCFIGKANCGNPTGSVTGILVTGEELKYQWKASDGSIVSDSLNLTNMPAGIYSLNITYGNNCSIAPILFEIEGSDAPQIVSIMPFPDYCNRGNGKLIVDAVTNTGDSLMYSLDGTNFSTSSLFTGLLGDTYTATVKDINGCIDTLSIEVENLGGPVVLDSIATDENGYNANGSINIVAQGDSLYYSLIGVDIPQATGTFTGLSANDYVVSIKDKWGCERLVYMTIERINGILLSASASDDYKCKKELAYSTLTAENFINVKQFKAVLNYDYSKLNCSGFYPSAEFPDIKVKNFTGSVELEWNSTIPKTFSGSVALVDLIFETIKWGTMDIKWDTTYSVFIDSSGNSLMSALHPGVITINDPPVLKNISDKNTFCEGDKAELKISKSGGTPPFEFYWQIPGNTTFNDTLLVIDSILLSQAGNYKIGIKDYNKCSDSLEIPVMVFALPTANFP